MHADDFRFSALSKGIQGGGSAPQASLQPVLPQSKSNYCKFYATKHGNSILPLFLISSYPNFCGYINFFYYHHHHHYYYGGMIIIVVESLR